MNGAQNNFSYDIQAYYEKQLESNQSLKDLILHQRAMSSGTVLEAQNLQQKINFQDCEINDIHQ